MSSDFGFSQCVFYALSQLQMADISLKKEQRSSMEAICIDDIVRTISSMLSVTVTITSCGSQRDRVKACVIKLCHLSWIANED